MTENIRSLIQRHACGTQDYLDPATRGNMALIVPVILVFPVPPG